MTDLLVLKAFGADSAGSPEFQYLLSLVVLQAREAFGRAELPDRFASLEGAFEVDTESLSTKGFYVVVTPAATAKAST